MIPVPVYVTQQTIDRGQRHDCSLCPAAVALAAVLRPGVKVYVTSDVFSLEGPYYSMHDFALPLLARLFVLDFDSDLPVRPFSFVAKIPAVFLPRT